MARTGRQGTRFGGGGGQHFLLSPEARRLSLAKVARLTDEEAFTIFCRIRWCDTKGEPVCPKCAMTAAYKHKSRPIFSCKACGSQFSVTSGTMFHGRKVPLRTILLAIAIFANGAKGHAALQLGRELDVSYKTAFVLSHKLREAMGREAIDMQVSGTVEVDGAYFGGYVKPANRRKDRVDRRFTKNQNGKRRVVVTMRERGGRTATFVVRNEVDAVATIAGRIAPGSVVHADEARSWDALAWDWFEMRRINHEEAYSDGNACTNGAESFFSRIRRAEIGIHHHVAGPYLDAYSAEMAWREDAKRIDNGMQTLMIGLATLTSGRSERWRGYWQRHRRLHLDL